MNPTTPDPKTPEIDGKRFAADMGRMIMFPTCLLLVAAAVFGVGLLRHGFSWNSFIVMMACFVSIPVFFYYPLITPRDGARPSRGLFPMFVSFGGLVPYGLGCYLTFYEGLWGLFSLFGNFSLPGLLSGAFFSFLGFKIVDGFYKVTEICRAVDKGKLIIRREKGPETKHGKPSLVTASEGKKTLEREKILSAYGQLLQKNAGIGEFRDVSELPATKSEILDAITFAIICETDDKRVEILKSVALYLVDYQEAVGPKPISMLGVSAAELSDTNSSLDALRAQASKIANNPDQGKYESLKIIADEELLDIQNKLSAAEQLREQMPEEKKRQILR